MIQTTIEFQIDMEAKSTQYGGKRLSTRGGRPRFFRDDKAQAYIDEMTLRFNPHRLREPLVGPVELDVTFVIPRPGRLNRKKDFAGLIRVDTRPDAGNYGKVLCDVMTQCGFWIDDGQVSDEIYRKRFAEKDGHPRIIVKITTLAYELTNNGGDATPAGAA